MIYILISGENNVTLGGTVLPTDGQAWVEYTGVIPAVASSYVMVDGVIVINPEEITKAKADKIEELYKDYDADNAQDVDYMTTTFQADAASQLVLVSVLSVGSVPVGFYWKDLANAKITMTFTELQGLSSAILERGQVNFDKLDSLKATVTAALDLSGIEAVYWTEPVVEAEAVIDAIDPDM